MELDTARCIVEVAENHDIYLDLREDYSGRGMYGKTTAGVVGSFKELIAAVAAAGVSLEEGSADAEEFIKDMQCITIDNMARDYIIY